MRGFTLALIAVLVCSCAGCDDVSPRDELESEIRSGIEDVKPSIQNDGSVKYVSDNFSVTLPERIDQITDPGRIADIMAPDQQRTNNSWQQQYIARGMRLYAVDQSAPTIVSVTGNYIPEATLPDPGDIRRKLSEIDVYEVEITSVQLGGQPAVRTRYDQFAQGAREYITDYSTLNSASTYQFQISVMSLDPDEDAPGYIERTWRAT